MHPSWTLILIVMATLLFGAVLRPAQFEGWFRRRPLELYVLVSAFAVFVVLALLLLHQRLG